jgi:radical SAM protein with 4Fe4S-binding SPASM domain
MMQQLRPWEVNFLTLNYWNDANEIDTIDYASITPSIHLAIDKLVTFVPKINVRYTPYCYMIGYEQYVCNYYQHIYDVYDWNIAVYNGAVLPEDYKNQPMKHLYESAKQNRNRTYYKSRDCTGCKYYYICDGVEKTIKDFTFAPQEGDKITNPNHYRVGWYK